MIFKLATGKHLGIVRFLVFSILLIDLAVDDFVSLSLMPLDAFVRHGILQFIPKDVLADLLTAKSLQLLGFGYAGVLVLGLAGLGPSWLISGMAIVGTTFFQGVARGFGGHVNHQELIVLHSLFFLIFPIAFDAFSLNNLICRRNRIANTEVKDYEDSNAGLLLRGLSFWILFTYFVIGVARLQTSDLRVYQTNAISMYAFEHSHKWNYWNFGYAKNILDQGWLEFLTRVGFPFATLLEISAILALFIRRLTLPIIALLIVFHLSIWMFMNIFFWQNILLLSIPIIGWYVDRKWQPSTPDGKPIIVFFDSECGLCDGFVRSMLRADDANLVNFAPLVGETAKTLGITPVGNRLTWTIVTAIGQQKLQRSDAVLTILMHTRRWADVAALGLLIPRMLRDPIYIGVARWRHLVKRREDTCMLTSEHSQKFLP